MKLVDLCCGCGGLSLGMLLAGHEIVAAYDNDPGAIANYNLNLGDAKGWDTKGQDTKGTKEGAKEGTKHAHLSDLRELSAADLPACDGIIGGPPCQPFSNGLRNNRTIKGPTDERNALPDFVRIVVEKRPPFFLIENVMGLLQFPAFLTEQFARLFQAGYFVVPTLLTAWRYSVPQERRRLFIAGYRGGKLPQWPGPTSSRTQMTTRLAIGHLLTRETSRPKPDWIQRKFAGRDEILADTRNRGYSRRKGRYFHARSIDLPAYTVLASERHGSKVVVIGEECWSVSIEHNRILQTFPDWWRFPSDHDTAQRLIGNAVPPAMAQRIGEAIG